MGEVMIQTWNDAKEQGLTQVALQELCDYDHQLEQRIITNLKRKHPNASDKQITNWVRNCMKAKYQREHWGYSNLDIIRK